ncbi:flagellar basal body rod protein FlgB [Pseudoxanthomonas composti]|uniref:Flagellar basal body rod protein FlgB n=1 Tax=Pseudoxanthomonas composti TaxID=2137479 RepID=A0A4Q1JU12_9GAMM|nr:flagellar basal body rod protein FlgB [Pseudoxanthomonas composti]RXR02683.1 flagellar basal body rod protein FlgB [Pseudoxanthomonas composti]
MSDPLSSYMGFHAQALPLREQRMKLIASNLANVDTPGYQAQDLDFNAALNSALRQAERPAGAGDALGGQIGGPNSLESFQLARPSSQPSLDGNTVDPDGERAAYGRAALEYRATLSFMEGKVRTLMTAITGQ